MKNNLAIAFVAMMLLGTLGVTSAMAQEISRTFDKDSINPSIPDDAINVTLTGTHGDFQVFSVNETVPEGFEIVAHSDNLDMKNENSNVYQFVGISNSEGFTASYTMKAKDPAPAEGTYNVSGTFQDSYGFNGVITPDPTVFKFTTNFEAGCDKNNDHYISRDEVIDAVSKYFTQDNITVSDVFTVVWDYFRHSYIEY